MIIAILDIIFTMKLIHKLLLSYFLITFIIGGFSTAVLMYNINKSMDNLSIYREREIKSFVKVIETFIIDKKSLSDVRDIQNIFMSLTKKLPHIRRLTLHAQNEETLLYTHIASSIPRIIGTPSYPEDIDAIENNKMTILYENDKNENFIDITHPITDIDGKAIAALGVAVSLTESDSVLNKALENMRNNAMNIVLIALIISIVLSLIISVIISKKIISPIKKLKNAALSIGEDKKHKKIEIKSNDEIGELATAFNLMSDELNTLHLSMKDKIEEKTDELQKQFFTDSLTGLANRQALLSDMKIFDKFSLAILDISSFKDINDVYGIDIGNRVLIELSKKYQSYIFDSGLYIYRISGDETAIINTDSIPKADFIELINHIVKSIEHETFYFEEDSIEINISLHAGISCEMNLSLEKANIALIKAKEEHLDYWVFNEEKLLDRSQENNILTISKIKNAVNNYGFHAYYQPIVNKNGKTLKYEALVRMKNNGETISPYFFLDISKKSKYYQHITRSMIFQAFNEFESSSMMISVNICADDLLNEDTKAFIINQLENFEDTNRVVFELVESEDLHEIRGLKEFISTIKSFGCKIAIDDFGAGYSNFSYLLDLEPNYLKIDGSLIKNIDKDEKSYSIVDTIVTFAHNLNITVIAEFVHSKEILDICQELNIDEYQGYYFGEPSKTPEKIL